MKLLTPKKCVNLFVNLYPSLYASTSLEMCKLRVYDQIFNVNGNGIRNTNEYIEHMRDRRKNVHTPPQKYLSGERLYYGYTEVKTYGEGKFKFEVGESDSCLDEVFSESEMADHPEVKHWMGFDPFNKFIPYPNFAKDYSIIWRMDTNILSQEWIDEIIWFYKKCEEFFNGPDSNDYSYAVTKDPIKLEMRIRDQDNYLKKYFKTKVSIQESWDQISKDYETEYRGDTLDFIQRRWEAEKNRILQYITETIDMLTKLKK